MITTVKSPGLSRHASRAGAGVRPLRVPGGSACARSLEEGVDREQDGTRARSRDASGEVEQHWRLEPRRAAAAAGATRASQAGREARGATARNQARGRPCRRWPTERCCRVGARLDDQLADHQGA
jgi:hypothetical protein